MQTLSTNRGRRIAWRSVITLVAVLAMLLPGSAFAQSDPREGLPAGAFDAGEVYSGLDRDGFFDKRTGSFINPGNLGDFGFVNSDLAFQGDYAFMGNFNGFQVFDISNPGDPVLKAEVLCPGGQGDPSVYGNLLFMSVEENRGRTDCGTTGNPPGAQAERFRGVRIFDISNPLAPVNLGGVQLCRGSHTHSVVEDLDDAANVYIYNSGTAGQRDPAEAVHTPQGFATGRCNQVDPTGANPSMWMTEIIKVPLANPAAASVVTEARLFTDPVTGAVNGLQNAPQTPNHPSGIGWGPNPVTNTCHDITAHPEIGLAAGACQGNGILIDISDVANPVRIDAVADPVFAYWHSATFNNEGTKVLFTDEWGGGTAARCRVTDQPSWGANALFDIVDTGSGLKMEFASYYKVPIIQTNQENCVAHNGSLLPVPGRDIMIQAWYQGGVSLLDFTDTANPKEIAYFDRGPISGTTLVLGGLWSTYWYNGRIFGSEIARGLDVWTLAETGQMSAAEIASALEIEQTQVNVQGQRSYSWGPSANVVGAFRDQAIRAGNIGSAEVQRINAFLAQAGAATNDRTRNLAASSGYAIADRLDPEANADLIDAIVLLADDLNPRD